MPTTHGISAANQKTQKLWESCPVQTYFTGKGLIDYFRIVDPLPAPRISGINTDNNPLTPAERTCFEKIETDYREVRKEILEQAGIVHDFEDSRSARVPWLERLGFPSHLKDLRDAEIGSSYKLPSPHQLVEESSDDPVLMRIILATKCLLHDAHALCRDDNPHRKLTYQRACLLNEFDPHTQGKTEAFRHKILASSLTAYFKTWIQLVVYYYRVVHADDEHFTRTDPEQLLPPDVIQPTSSQRNTFHKVMSLAQEPSDDHGVSLQHALRQFFLALICHVLGSQPFASPVLSFCAILARTVRRKHHAETKEISLSGGWKEPGDFSSHLSALIWVAQLVIFDYACFQEQDDERQIPVFLSSIGQKFFHRLAETPWGYILQWRLYLRSISRQMLSTRQARWSSDRQTVGYNGAEMHMSHVPTLVVSEYREAQSLFYHELLFDSSHLFRIQAWQVQDDLDLADFGESWLTLPENHEILAQTDTALLRYIQSTPKFRKLFLTQQEDGEVTFHEPAMAMYESYVQRFLQLLLILIHITAGQPLREPELLSITWRNTSRPRNVRIWEKLVMIFTQYHKGQHQSGVYKDNIRFLPGLIGNLLLQFLCYVQPLRQVFLRQRQPKTLISSYLWTTLDGKVWPDGTVTACLERACSRAKIDRLTTNRWRHMSAAICKEKFSTSEYTYFDPDSATTEDFEDEQDLVILASQRNHAYQTSGLRYAGSTMLTMDVLLHRNHRASKLWHDLFKFEAMLQGKRERSGSDVLALRLAHDIKRGQERQRRTYTESDLLLAARRLHHQPQLQFREPGQRAAVLAVLGPSLADQVVVILGTGSGKTMIITLGVSLGDARTTILVVPLVALRNDLLGRFRQVGIQPLIWNPTTRRTASLVIVAVEAACTDTFLDYAQGLTMRQQLDRIVVDESHLTITASEYRPSMVELGWFLAKVKVQSVWLTATLPPCMQDAFIQQNILVRPRIVRESTNRANLEYHIRVTSGNLHDRVHAFLQRHLTSPKYFAPLDKILVYCNTHVEVRLMGEMLSCPTYMSTSGTPDIKAKLIAAWLADSSQRILVATTALGPGFDYAHVRWVIHVDAPYRLTEFSQASGRAGRDGHKALSIIFLPSTWTPSHRGYESSDHEAMELYLTGRHCFRGILSQFLDVPPDWRWCTEGDERCGFCQAHPARERRPRGLCHRFEMTSPPRETAASQEVLARDCVRDRALEAYERDLAAMREVCLYCRLMSRPFSHAAARCPQRWDWIRAKQGVLAACEQEGRSWCPRYVVCWKCLQPQSICERADPESEARSCVYGDMVMPLCYGVYQRAGGVQWLARHFGVQFPGELAYLRWLGESSQLEGNRCIEATRVMALALSEMGG